MMSTLDLISWTSLTVTKSESTCACLILRVVNSYLKRFVFPDIGQQKDVVCCAPCHVRCTMHPMTISLTLIHPSLSRPPNVDQQALFFHVLPCSTCIRGAYHAITNSINNAQKSIFLAITCRHGQVLEVASNTRMLIKMVSPTRAQGNKPTTQFYFKGKKMILLTKKNYFLQKLLISTAIQKLKIVFFVKLLSKS